MNLSVFAGSAQFVMVDMWAPQLPVLEMIFAVMVINLRYLLIGASLNPVFQDATITQKSMIMHLSEKILPGKWYIVVGGVGGALLQLLHKEKSHEHS